MAQQFFQGTINTLSNLVQQEKAQRFAKQTPEYQQGLFNLMREKEQAIFQDTLRQQIMSGKISPVDAAVLMGKFDPFTQQMRGQQFQTRAKIEGLEAEKERAFDEAQAERDHLFKIKEIEARNRGLLQVKQTRSGEEDQGLRLILKDRLTGLNDFLRQGTLREDTPSTDLEDARLERDQVQDLLLKMDRGESISEKDLQEIEAKRAQRIQEREEVSNTLRILGLPDTPDNRAIAKDVIRKKQRGRLPVRSAQGAQQSPSATTNKPLEKMSVDELIQEFGKQ